MPSPETASSSVVLEKEHVPVKPADVDPMDIQVSLRTILLSANRNFREQGISRVIVSNYKDLLLQDVMERLAEFQQVFKRREKELEDFRMLMPMGSFFPPPGVNEFKQSAATILEKVAGYMKLFNDNPAFMIEAFRVVKQCSIWHCRSRQGVVELTLNEMLAGVSQHPFELTGPFVDLMCQLVCQVGCRSDPVDEWKHSTIDLVLDAGPIHLVLDVDGQPLDATTSQPNSLVEVMYCSLIKRPASRYYAVLKHLEAAHPSLQEPV